ncbi:hypothetical protein ACIQNG_34105 [Streptomyces sp. NPDC091377]|uniref:hypothetical protein n=1 Tax=Streptomyces sp. NPDC091377 TaxID=3365995 RepID=UPI003830B3A4
MSRPTPFRELVTARGWTSPDVFAEHYRKAAGDLARRPGLETLRGAFVLRRTFERWLSGDLKVKPRHEPRIILEHLFGIPVEQLFALPAQSAAGCASGHPSASGPSGAPTPARADAPPHLWGGRAMPGGQELLPAAGGRPGPRDVEVIRATLAALTSSDHQFGGGHAREYATGYLRRVVQPRLHLPMSDPVRQELFRAAAEFGVRVGWMHFDTGDLRQSGHFLAFALSAAEEAGDSTLVGWVLAMRGLKAVWAQDVPTALSYTQGAAGMVARSPGKARAFVMGKAALATSLTGDRAATQGLLCQVRGLLEQADGSGEPAWAGIYDLAYLRDEEGHCYRNLSMGTEAVAAEAEAMELRGTGVNGYTRLLAFSLSVQAVGYLQAGEVEQGCVVGTELAYLAPSVSSRRVQRRLQDVLDAAAPFREVPAVKDLYEVAGRVLVSASVPAI